MGDVRAMLERRFFRFVRYMFYNFRREFLDGTSEKKRHFIGRLTDFASRVSSLDRAGRALFMLQLYARGQMKTRGYRQWIWAIQKLENRPHLEKWMQVRRADIVRIIIFGAGSIGDLLQTTPILRAMRQKFPDGEIVFLHRSPAVKAVLGSNPHIDSTGFASFTDAAKLREAVATEGVADIFLEIESGTYVGRYTLAPEHLRSPALATIMPDAVFARAAESLRARQTRPEFEREDGTYGWPLQWRDFNFLDTLGATTALPIDRYSELDFDIMAEDAAFAASIAEGKEVVTIQNGVDDAVAKWAQVTGRQATKLLPLSVWKSVVEGLTDKNLFVVQLGTLDDIPVAGVSLDLRGRTSLRQAGALIQRAICHVGTEGGLVHLARAMNTKSVVLFGPTAVPFLGYPQNVNLAVGNCSSCWQAARDWFIYCPRGFEQAPCMANHDPGHIIEAVEKIRADVKLMAGQRKDRLPEPL